MVSMRYVVHCGMSICSGVVENVIKMDSLSCTFAASAAHMGKNTELEGNSRKQEDHA
jgi:hypothetical protein